MITINFRPDIKSFSPATNSGEDSAKLSSEVGRNFSRANFHTPTVKHERVFLLSLT